MTDFEEPQGDTLNVQRGAESEADPASECDTSDDSDDSDAEVPDVRDAVASTNLLQGAGDGQRFAKLSSGVENSSSSGSSSRKEVEIGRVWKPIVGGTLQGMVESSPMQVGAVGPVSSSPSVKQQTDNSPVEKVVKDGNESDGDVRRVPEISGKNGTGTSSHSHERRPTGPSPRKRGGSSADKEPKRLKRLLRNRVSAQQARERKKAYLSELEIRSKELEHRNAELEERVSTLQRENQMLRQIVKNTALKKSNE